MQTAHGSGRRIQKRPQILFFVLFFSSKLPLFVLSLHPSLALSATTHRYSWWCNSCGPVKRRQHRRLLALIAACFNDSGAVVPLLCRIINFTSPDQKCVCPEVVLSGPCWIQKCGSALLRAPSSIYLLLRVVDDALKSTDSVCRITMWAMRILPPVFSKGHPGLFRMQPDCCYF